MWCARGASGRAAACTDRVAAVSTLSSSMYMQFFVSAVSSSRRGQHRQADPTRRSSERAAPSVQSGAGVRTRADAAGQTADAPYEEACRRQVDVLRQSREDRRCGRPASRSDGVVRTRGRGERFRLMSAVEFGRAARQTRPTVRSGRGASPDSNPSSSLGEQEGPRSSTLPRLDGPAFSSRPDSVRPVCRTRTLLGRGGASAPRPDTEQRDAEPAGTLVEAPKRSLVTAGRERHELETGCETKDATRAARPADPR